LLFGGLLISATGSWAYNVALLAFVYDQTHSLGWVGAAGLARFVPQLVLSVYGGVIAERTERIRLMVGSDLLCALWQTGLALTAAVTGPPAVALVFAALTSITAVVYQPATAATIPSIVDEDNLVAANALNGMIDQLVVIASPAIGRSCSCGSASMVFAVNAASRVAALIVCGSGAAGPSM
jgi:DHA3 family macrolide efflux protein-like MFS transporter